MSIQDDYRAKHPKAATLADRARQAIPGGITHDIRNLAPYPVYVERVHRGLRPAREAVDGAGGNARVDHLPLVGRRVQQPLPGEAAELGDDAVGAPVRHPGHHELVDRHHGRDAGDQRALARQPSAHAAHADLVAAVSDADRDRRWRLL